MAVEGKQILFEGRFQKRGSSYKTWHLRYFKLYDDFTFNYYKGEKGLNHPKGSGDLSLVKEVTFEEEKQICFITQGNNRDWFFIFEHEKQQSYWINVAELIINEKQDEIEKYADPKSEHHMKVVIVGQAGVGKTAFLLKYMYDYFEASYDPTLEDIYNIEKEVDGEKYVLTIMDTAGQEEYQTLAHANIRDADALIVCYSIADRDSFNHLKTLHDEISHIRDDNIDRLVIIMVGTKVDLNKEGKREIETEEGQRCSEELGCPFLETSAVEGTNIEKTFLSVISFVNKVREELEEKTVHVETGSCKIS